MSAGASGDVAALALVAGERIIDNHREGVAWLILAIDALVARKVEEERERVRSAIQSDYDKASAGHKFYRELPPCDVLVGLEYGSMRAAERIAAALGFDGPKCVPLTDEERAEMERKRSEFEQRHAERFQTAAIRTPPPATRG